MRMIKLQSIKWVKQSGSCLLWERVRVKVWHTHTTVWLLQNYSQRILTYYTRILLLAPTYGRTIPQANQTLHDVWPSPGLVLYVYIFGRLDGHHVCHRPIF